MIDSFFLIKRVHGAGAECRALLKALRGWGQGADNQHVSGMLQQNGRSVVHARCTLLP